MQKIIVIFLLLFIIMPEINLNFSTLRDWMNSAFYPLIFNQDRYNIIYGGAGSGKSYSQAQKVVFSLSAIKGHNYLIVRKTARTNRYSTFALIKSIIYEWKIDKLFKINYSDMSITNWTNGNKAIFSGLDDTEKLKSITFESGPLTDIWIEEASECDKTDFIDLDLRLRGIAAVPFQITLTFNPISDMHWIKKHFFDEYGIIKIPINKFIGGDSFTILRTTYKQNRFLDKQYIKTLESLKDLDRTYYEVYALGEWGVYGDVVFSNYKIYDFDVNMVYDDIISGMDFGFNHYYAIEKIGVKNNELYFYDELYTRQKTTREVIEINQQENVLLKSDCCTADSADPSAIKEWTDEGYEVSGAKKGKDSVKSGFSYLKTRKLHIHSKCTGIASEIKTLKYKQDKDGNTTDEVVSYRDDAFAAARYATEQLWTQESGAFALINSDIGL